MRNWQTKISIALDIAPRFLLGGLELKLPETARIEKRNCFLIFSEAARDANSGIATLLEKISLISAAVSGRVRPNPPSQSSESRTWRNLPGAEPASFVR
jgi:hypothetical protein